MAIGRRAFLSGLALTVAATRLRVADAGLPPPPDLPADPFRLGVASGDPLTDRVILWTRLAPDPLAGGGMAPLDFPVSWEVATDAAFADVVAAGDILAAPELGHSVHVDASGLDPDTWYWYRFTAGGYDSPVGRTRTAPAAGCSPDRLRFGFASCQSYTNGYYTAHAHLATEGLDLVCFLGDYIYEGGGSGVRAHNSGEIFTLDEYRNRYALYKGDPDLQAAHAACPWLVTWDDHEVDNNYAADNAHLGDPAAFLVRRAAGYQAYYEHQPLRLAPPTGPDFAIHRAVPWGDLAQFFLLDTRQYRSPQPCGGDLLVSCDEVNDPDTTILGAAQEAWLVDGLGASDATWNVLAQQVVFAAMPIVGFYNPDQWDGYMASRRRMIDTFARPDVHNPVVITGDIHASGHADLLADFDDPDSAVVGTELVGTSITSSFPPELVDPMEQIVGDLPWVNHVDAQNRGYVVVDVTRDAMRADYRVVDTITSPTATLSTAYSAVIEAGAPGSSACEVASPATTAPPAPPASAVPVPGDLAG